MIVRVFVILALILYCGLGSIAAYAEGMTVEEAYRALPHQRTKFDLSRAKMSKAEATYLDHLFFVTDLSFRERMVMLRYFYAGQDHLYIKEYNKEIGTLLASFELINAPTDGLKQVEELVIASVREQKAFFNEWHKARGKTYYRSLAKNYTSHKLVQSSHYKLIQAYGLLKQSYRGEIGHNQQSFYDHLCALDFI